MDQASCYQGFNGDTGIRILLGSDEVGPCLVEDASHRALYIFKDGKDTLYRVHGTPDWQSVGKATSSGCVRMFNQDVIDLFERVPDNTPIVVI